MDDDEKYWENLEKIFVHDVYDRISSKYDEFFKLSHIRFYSKDTKKESNNDVDNLINNENYSHINKKNLKCALNKQIDKNNGKSQQRHNEWPKVRNFLLQIEPYSLIADVGCGEGKYLNVNSHVLSIGSDRSSSLCQLASYRDLSNSTVCNKNQILICDNLLLPFRSDLFDAVISIGVIHHLSTPKRRIKAVKELARILKPGGKIMIYVWAMEQRLRKFKCQDVLVPMLNTNNNGSKSQIKLSLRRDLSNNSAVNSEDSNDESFTDKLFNSLNSTSFKNLSTPVEKKSFSFRSNYSSKDDGSSNNDENEKYELVKFDTDYPTEADTQTTPKNTPNSPINQKSNFVDSIKRFFSQKILLTKEDSNESNTHLIQSSPNLIKTNSFLVEDPNTIERYRRIIDDHKDLLPENFTIRQFPFSSCQDTFENNETKNHDESKLDLNLNTSSSSTSPSSTSQYSPISNQCENSITSNLSNVKLNGTDVKNEKDSFLEDTENKSNKRFYHVFRRNELDKLIKENCPDLVIYESYYDHGNWGICARKEK